MDYCEMFDFRNEVWRYKGSVSVWSGAAKIFFRGIVFAIPAVIATVAIDKAFGITESRKAEAHATLASYPGNHHTSHH